MKANCKTLLYLTLLGFLVSATAAQAQTLAPAIRWDKTIGGSNHDWNPSVTQAPDGGYYVVGNSESSASGTKTENSRGGADCWILKYDAAWNLQWQKTIGGDSSEQRSSIKVTPDGGFYLLSSSKSTISGEKTAPLYGDLDIWVVKCDGLGNIQWQKTYGGSEHDHFTSIAFTSDGGYIIGGASRSGISGNKGDSCRGNTDAWVIKADSLGNIQWQKTLGTIDEDEVTGLRTTADGGYLICVHTWIGNNPTLNGISGDKTVPAVGGRDAWILKLDANGSISWQKVIGGSGDDFITDFEPTSDGGFLLTSWSSSPISGDKTEDQIGPPTGSDLWIVKADGEANVEWDRTIGTTHQDVHPMIIESVSGGCIVAASSSGHDVHKSESTRGTDDLWLVKLSNTGQILWEKTAGGKSMEIPSGLLETSDGGILVSVRTTSGQFAEKSQPSLGNTDFWLIQFAPDANGVLGTVFQDYNGNGVFNNNDDGFPRLMVKAEKGSRAYYASTNMDGYYVHSLDSGSYNISITPPQYYTQSLPSSNGVYAHQFSALGNIADSSDFGLHPTANITDMEINLSGVMVPRPGFDFCYRITYTNVGTVRASGTIDFTPDSLINYTGQTQWTFTNVPPFKSVNIDVCVRLDSTIALGTGLISSARVTTSATDANLSNNLSIDSQGVVGSYDPNDKTVLPSEGLTPVDVSDGKKLEYIIRFQNTGTFPAEFVRIVDTLDARKLDLTTFRIVSASHNYDYKITGEGILTLYFNNIQLPDSNSNEPKSHGFIRYTLKPFNTLQLGDQIRNTAYIYFDFNAPVVTNTVITEIQQTTSATNANGGFAGQAKLYPNPATHLLTISLPAGLSGSSTLAIYDLQGVRVLHLVLDAQQSQADIAHLPTGLYIYRIEGPAPSTGKLIKQ